MSPTGQSRIPDWVTPVLVTVAITMLGWTLTEVRAGRQEFRDANIGALRKQVENTAERVKQLEELHPRKEPSQNGLNATGRTEVWERRFPVR